MTKAYSADFKLRILWWYLEDNIPMEEIAELARCSLGLVSKVVNIHRTHGTVVDPTLRCTGRPPLLVPEDIVDVRPRLVSSFSY